MELLLVLQGGVRGIPLCTIADKEGHLHVLEVILLSVNLPGVSCRKGPGAQQERTGSEAREGYLYELM